MDLPMEASGHHTVWIRPWKGGHTGALRYTIVDGHLYCFGDDDLSGVADGERVSATIHRIANGPPLAGFSATIRTVAPAQVELATISDLVGNSRPSGGFDEGLRRMGEFRTERRVVELVS